jgi:hypothetical protein
MAALQHSAPARVALTTVDARDQAFCSWLERCGAELVISQDEMVREASSC